MLHPGRFPTKSRCRFTQYIASKPDKYGIKFFLLVDVVSKYLCNGFPYLGKDEERPGNLQLAEHVVMRLMDGYLNKGHNIVCDNFFTSLSLAETLLIRDTTLLGTMRHNRREMPQVDEIMKKCGTHDTKVLTTESGCTLTMYKCKPKKTVCILSSLHKNVSIAENGKKKPITVTDYNAGKFGVDIVDQMAKKYSTKCSTRRWPVAVFANVLDLTSINAWILYSRVCEQKISRRNFILSLVKEMCHSEDQASTSNQFAESQRRGEKRKKCQIMCKNKTSTFCSRCKKCVCGSCTAEKRFFTICVNCI